MLATIWPVAVFSSYRAEVLRAELGLSDDELAGLACRNVLRVLREAEAVAAALGLQ